MKTHSWSDPADDTRCPRPGMHVAVKDSWLEELAPHEMDTLLCEEAKRIGNAHVRRRSRRVESKLGKAVTLCWRYVLEVARWVEFRFTIMIKGGSADWHVAAFLRGTDWQLDVGRQHFV